ncbi:MAG: hypothetical protein K9M95_08135 [Candidatus Cloacimonetes bacterium]|nr:hypothetical protein [Candidatus Cloacimonadota bacterium]MCF7813985.1 hypothetical protein [Candidatus Cloacimonadota bacterium]MCF7884088.1 hypothetical protein [Candidatus Cloacimonadota bacterium]
MIFERLLALIIIGGGFFIWNAIFKAYPLRKEYEEKPLLAWMFGFLIIIGQLAYIYKIFSKLFIYGDSVPIFLLVIIIVIFALITLMLWKRYGE